MIRSLVPIAVVLALATLPSAAMGSVADEQREGQALARALADGRRSCDSLSADEFERVGEYVMGRMVGSSAAHGAMNAHMASMMSVQAEERIHQLMGARFAGCAGRGDSGGTYGPMMGPGMMGDDYDGYGDWGSMMESSDWNWMMGGTWRGMSREDWQNLADRWLGSSSASALSGGGWQTRDTLLVVLAGVLAAGLLSVLLVWRPWRKPPA